MQSGSWPTRNCVQRKRKPWLIPVRFVTACPQGHIQDFPFREWVHRGQPGGPQCQLRMLAGRSSAGLTGIRITCTCGQSRSLGGIFDFNDQNGGAFHRIGCDCQGFRPWLGEWENPPGCGQFLQVVQRGASNVYFPHVVSSIYLPLWAEAAASGIVKALEDPRIWGPLSSGLVDGKVSPDRCEMVASMRNLDPKDLLAAAQRKLEGIPEPSALIGQTEEAFRRSEYDALKAGARRAQSDLLVETASLTGTNHRYPRPSRISPWSLSFAKHARSKDSPEFCRPDGNLTSPRLQRLALDQRIDWLPAMIVRGEGIFLEFDTGRMDAWLRGTPLIAERLRPLNGRYNQRRIAQGQPRDHITSVRASSHFRACGYQSACLRMRIRKRLPAGTSVL